MKTTKIVLSKNHKTKLGLASALTLAATVSISSCSSLHASSNNAHTVTTPPKTANNVDLSRYAGTWYEIARIPMFFQRNCISDVTATYTNLPNGTVKVLNQCKGKDGKIISANGRAKVDANYPSANNSKLLVNFLPNWLEWLPVGEGGYWVLALDDNYQHALIGSPNRKYLWLLSRTPTVSDATYQQYLSIAKQQGYDTSNMVTTIHNQK